MTMTEDATSKLVGTLLLELVEDVLNKPGFESVKADLLAASRAYEANVATIDITKGMYNQALKILA